ncbi:o-succinylbenzoate--CoA ligase [Nocardioides caeni]|uniref:AMP-dependent synthetase n=1 Tax=Nocardioides caeni TaxID=574700 RepID=A0A4S8N9W5_9ACTN|nr:AMP-dependent synthetase [Nocardioides caeni]
MRGSFDEVVDRVRDWLTDDGPVPDVVIETSGSSGTPKRVRLTRTALLASVGASAARLGASGPWVLALPPTYVAGLQVVARSLVAGHRPTLLERDGWPDGEGWFVSLVPTQLTRMLESPDDLAALRRAHTVLLGGGPIGAALRERAAGAGVSVVATYGSAETAGGCVYDGMPLDGVALAIGVDGRIRIAGPTLFTEYDGQPDLTRDVLVDGWFRTSDAGRLDHDGRLVVIGRVDDVIVSGGLNVPGPAVAERLRAHAGVEEAEVLGVPDAEWGNRVVAFVVPAPAMVSRLVAGAPHSSTTAELRDWVAAAHPRAWAPRQWVVLDAIPLLPNGKPDRQALRALAARDETGNEGAAS